MRTTGWERAYRLALRLLPAAFRRRHGAEMVSLVREAAAGSGRGAARVWVAALADVVRRAPAERRRARRTARDGRRRVSMFGHDVRYGLRALRRQPFVSALVVAMLAIGIAANTAVFSVVNGLFLRPFPFPDQGRLVYINETAPRWNLEYTGINYEDFHTWRENMGAFDAIALFDGTERNVSDGAEAYRLRGLVVTHDFDDVLGVEPTLGRGILPEEDVPGGENVVVISDGLWRTRFAGDERILGRTLRMNGYEHTIVGVLPPETNFPGDAEFWLPFRGDPTEEGQSYGASGIGRMKAGVTLSVAHSDLLRAHSPIWERRDTAHVVSPVLLPLRDYFVGDLRPMSVALLGGVVVVLLIACANVASLMLARALARRREMGIRMAMGAGSVRLARQLFTENLLLACIGGVVGLLLGYGASRILVTRLPEQFPLWATFNLDVRVLLFSLGLTSFTAVLFGWAPAWIAARSDVRETLQQTSGRTTATGGARRALGGLIVAEVALAVVLLVGGGLLLRAYERVTRVDPGFDPENVLTFALALPAATYPDSQSQRPFWALLLPRLEALPGVRAVGTVTCLPLGCHNGSFLEVEGASPAPGQQDPVILFRTASSGYFEAMGIDLAAGRFFDERDERPDAAGTVIVNETFARHFWPNDPDPVGRRLRGRGSDGPWATVVGVARDVRHYGLETPMRPGIYVPSNIVAERLSSLSIVVKAERDALALVNPIRQVVRAIDPTIPLAAVGTMKETLRRSLLLRETYSWALAIFAALALALAVGGIYGVTSYVVTQRTREIGIRIALGARTTSVVRTIVSRGMSAVVAGVVIGLVGAFAAARALSGLLFGIAPADAPVYAVVAAVLLATALAAHGVPARRAARTDPMRSLNTE